MKKINVIFNTRACRQRKNRKRDKNINIEFSEDALTIFHMMNGRHNLTCLFSQREFLVLSFAVYVSYFLLSIYEICLRVFDSHLVVGCNSFLIPL